MMKKLSQARRGFREEALRARDITRQAFPVDKRNTRYVAPARLDETTRGWKVTTITKVPGERARAHVVTVHLPRGYEGTLNACPEVRIDCDCSRYVFVWNYALVQKNAAIRDRTNGEAPVETNPQEIAGCCVDGRSWIHTEFGSKQIRDIEVGDRVRTLAGLRRVTEVADMGVRDTVVIHTDSGRKLRVTPDHRVLAATPRGMKWLPAGHLTSDCYLVSASHETRKFWPRLPSLLTAGGSGIAIAPRRVPGRLTPDVAEFLGLLVAEGSGGSRGMSLSQFEPTTRARMIELSSRLFDRPSGSSLRLGAQVGRLIESWGIRLGSHRVRVPHAVMSSSNDIVSAFLKGYYAGDGWFSRDGRYSTAGTASAGLRDDLLYLLGRLNIRARNTTGRSGHAGTVMHQVRTSDPENTGRAIDSFLPDRCEAMRVVKGSRGRYDSGSIYDRVPLAAVQRVLRGYAEEVADATVGDDNLVPVSVIAATLPGLRIRTLLKEGGCISEVRNAKGGKPSHYSTLNLALRVSRAARIRNLLYGFHIRSSGPTVHREKIEAMLTAIPTRYAEDLRARLSIFLRDDVFFEKVSHVVAGGSTNVFDIGVERNEHFFANGLCVHNCKHAIVALGALTKLNPRWPTRVVTRRDSKSYGKPITLTSLRQAVQTVRKR
jgi:intein/homing endonuclease